MIRRAVPLLRMLGMFEVWLTVGPLLMAGLWLSVGMAVGPIAWMVGVAGLNTVLNASAIRGRWGDLRRAERSSLGLCPTCGYDLRASPDRCPECGKGPATVAK